MSEEVPQEMKRCFRGELCCSPTGAVQSLDCFGNKTSTKDGKREVCFSCRSKYNREYRQKHRQEVVDHQREYRQANSTHVLELAKIAYHRRQNTISRFRSALSYSNRQAKKRNFVPCSASAEELMLSFTGKCHICGISESACKRRLNMDHDHTTGCFRGWLCSRCNLTLGKIKDSLVLLRSLIEYLERAKECQNLPVHLLQKNAPTPAADAPLFSST